MDGKLESPPTLVERWFAGGLLLASLMACIGVTLLFLWWLYEAATFSEVRGHQGLWVRRADDPGLFWFNVGMDVFWAAATAGAAALVLRRLAQKGEWAKATRHLVRRWRQLAFRNRHPRHTSEDDGD